MSHHHHHHHHDREGEFREGEYFQPDPYQQGGYPSQPYQPGYVQQPYQPGYPAQPYPGQRRLFQIMSRMNRKVVDIEGANPSENTKVIMYDPHGTERNQLWYFDEQGIIRSALNDMVFFSEHGDEGHHLKMVYYTGHPAQQWRFDFNKIMNGVNRCLDIKGAHHHNGAELCAYDFKGAENQHWELCYID